MLELTFFNVLAVGAGAVLAILLLDRIARRWAGTRDDDVELVSSLEFGGGWAFPKTWEGRIALQDFYREPPYELIPFGGELGYVVEPQDTAMLCDHLNAEGVRWSFR